MQTSWWLELKLGARMLVKHPGLTLAGGVGICVAVAIAVEGDRIVSLEVWDTAANRAERRVWHELTSWQEQLRSTENLGAFRTTTSNLIAPGVPLATVQVAAIGAAGFRVRRVRPLLGPPPG